METRRRIKFVLLIVVFVVLGFAAACGLGGCAGGDESDGANAPPTTLPPSPQDEGLAGFDANGDGVRDDIEEWIERTYSDSEKTRSALRQNAKVLQAAILDADDKTKSIQHAEENGRAGDCLAYVRSDDFVQLSREIEARVVNTDERLRAYLRYNTQLEGEVFSAPPFDQWKLACEFDPDVMAD